MKGDLETMSDKRAAIVTGAGKGIGRAVAVKLAAAGVAVCCNSVTDSAAAVAAEITASGGSAVFVRADVSVKADVTRLVREAAAAFGGIDILVNNAGIVLPGTVENTTEADWDATFAVNVKSVYLLSQEALPQIIARGGVIVNTASSVALKGVTDRFAYTASKGAVVALTRAMAADLLGKGVRVNCVCPGTTWTPSLEGRLARFSNYEEKKAEFAARQPIGRFGAPDEIADAVIYLINAAFCTGAVLSVDGGMTI
jgi:NAD(P)-dependent dehydrogenase (short-subunit alcohol dehydrogenase family)